MSIQPLLRTPRGGAAQRPPLTRSPLHLYTLLVGLAVSGTGWIAATVFEASIAAVSNDLIDLSDDWATWADSLPESVATVGTVAAMATIVVWLTRSRHVRELLLAAVAALTAALASTGAADALMEVLHPQTRAWFEDLPSDASRLLPTDPVVAAVVAVLVLVRRSLPTRLRHGIYLLLPVWLLANVTMTSAPPYLGVVLDVGIGMVAGSATALVLRTPSVRPGRSLIIGGLADVGIEVSTLEPAPVDARGSSPWLATTRDGRALFVKALSTEQRAADLMFRAMRWMRLRRTGDAPPETSLRRSAEHEAFVSHHARMLGVPTPMLLAVAEVGDGNVALVYEARLGRSLDRVPPQETSDDHLRQLWHHVRLLRENGVAHRDLRLANVFLTDEGEILLLDFGFAELAAKPHVLDDDVAEALAATAAVVGAERAVQVAAEVLGTEPLEGALEWMHPLGLTSATRQAVADGDVLGELRGVLARRVGHGPLGAEPIGRIDVHGVVALAFIMAGFGWLIVSLPDDDAITLLRSADADLGVLAVIATIAFHVAVGLAYRSASERRVPALGAARAHLSSLLPRRSPTTWAAASEAFSRHAVEEGVTPRVARDITSLWTRTSLTVAPLLVAGLAAAALRESRGYLFGITIGAAIGFAMTVAIASAIWCTPWGSDLRLRWSLSDERPEPVPGATAGAAMWWAAAAVLRAIPLVLAVRALEASTETQTVLAIGIAAEALASLTPTRGGLGSVELFLLAGLSFHLPISTAALAVVLYRVATYWLALPWAALASGWRPPKLSAPGARSPTTDQTAGAR